MQSLSLALHPDGTRARGSVDLLPAHSSASHGSCQGPPTAPRIPPKGIPGLVRLRLCRMQQVAPKRGCADSSKLGDGA